LLHSILQTEHSLGDSVHQDGLLPMMPHQNYHLW
jgi:hypothetical protein